MRAGLLRHRILVDEAVTAQDDTGDPVVSWTTRATVWGSIEPLRGRETLQAAQVLADMDTRIIIRWSPAVADITPRWRLRHQLDIYNVVSVANIGMRNVEMEIMARSGLSSG